MLNYYYYSNYQLLLIFEIKFNLALCEDSEHLQKSCRNILHNAVNKKFEDFKITRNGYFNASRNETSRENFQNICNNIKRQNQKPSSSIAGRHKAKYLRDNIKVFHHHRHNRRFRRLYRKRPNKDRKLLHQENQRKIIESIKVTCPDQNAINLSTQ